MTTLPESTVNIPLLRKAVEWAEAEAAKPVVAREWNQWRWLSSPRQMAEEVVDETPYDDDYLARRAAITALEPHCGTAFCIAGWVAQSVDARYATTDTVDGLHSSLFAAQALGIDLREQGPYSTHELFSANNTIADVRRIAEEIAGERL